MIKEIEKTFPDWILTEFEQAGDRVRGMLSRGNQLWYFMVKVGYDPILILKEKLPK